jgi:hypothetical protein
MFPLFCYFKNLLSNSFKAHIICFKRSIINFLNLRLKTKDEPCFHAFWSNISLIELLTVTSYLIFVLEIDLVAHTLTKFCVLHFCSFVFERILAKRVATRLKVRRCKRKKNDHRVMHTFISGPLQLALPNLFSEKNAFTRSIIYS